MSLSGGKGNSKANTQSSSSTTNTNITNVDNRVYTSDMGALTAAENIATASLDNNAAAFAGARQSITDAIADALGFGRDALTLADRTTSRSVDALSAGLSDSLTFADRQNTRVADTALESSTTALTFGKDVFGASGDLVSHAFDSAFEIAGGVLREGQVQLGNTVSNLNAIARQQSTTDSERVQDIAKQALYIGAVMVGLIAAAFIWSRS